MAKNKKGDFTISIEVNGEKLTASAPLLEDAILKLPAFRPKTRGTIVISKDGKSSKPITLNIVMLHRLFYPGMTGLVQRTMLAKRYAFFS